MNLEFSKTTPTSDANSLGVHVHAGTSCDTGAEVEGHWFDLAAMGADKDPWKTITYTSDANGVATFSHTLTKAQLGYDPYMAAGHAFVVHAADGSRRACGVLSTTRTFGVTVGAYPTYSGTKVGVGPAMGTLIVNPYAADNKVHISGFLAGLEKSVSATPQSEANSIGVHIHKGVSCATHEEVEGHYYNEDTFTADTDPWKTIT